MIYTDVLKLWMKNATDDPELGLELEAVKNKPSELEDRFYKELEFGTGGLRGVIGAGSNRMNIYTVRKVTQGYCDYLNEWHAAPSVAIAYDSRNKSKLFAETAAGVFAANGIKAYIFPELMPTPTLSYTVRKLQCSGGIVITASHNPAKYNGYKVYGADGCQITTQAASDILVRINDVDMFRDARVLPFVAGLEKGLISYIDSEIVTAYIDTVLKESLLGPEIRKEASIVYTPLNGTGINCVPRCLKLKGFADISIPEAQREPDGDFSTCPYPNPEIKEALSVAIDYAAEVGADLVLATDPDCDRVGAAVKTTNGYELLNGNQMGVLLLDFVCRMRTGNGTMPERPIAVKTIVTTEMAERVAAHYGVEIFNTLTGFKFIGEQIGCLEAAGEENRYIFGFEESYGYLSSTAVRDKDAVNASLLICEMYVWYKTQGVTLLEALDKLYEEFGCYTEKLLSFEFEGSSGFVQMQTLMASLREAPPSDMAGFQIEKADDYNREGTGLPKSDVLQYRLTGGTVATVRPSGTEPKLKIYLSARGATREDSAENIRELERYFMEMINEH